MPSVGTLKTSTHVVKNGKLNGKQRYKCRGCNKTFNDFTKSAFYYTSNAQVGYYRRVKENEKEVDVVVELPFGRLLCEVKYRENTHVKETDAIIELTNDEKLKVASTGSPNLRELGGMDCLYFDRH